MTIQEYMIDTTRRSAQSLWKYAKAVPADKIEWSPGEGARTVLDLARECAMCPDWCIDVITGSGPEWSEEVGAAIKAEQEQWKTVEDCEAECNRRLEKLYEYFRTIPDEKLTETKFLPYDGGRDFTVAEMMEYPHWNFDYHLGQIAYIQTLYGDKNMY